MLYQKGGKILYRVNYTVEFTHTLDGPPRQVRRKYQWRITANTDQQAMRKGKHLIAKERRSHRKGTIVKMISLVRVDKPAIHISEAATVLWQAKK